MSLVFLNLCVVPYVALTITNAICWRIIIYNHAVNKMPAVKLFVFSCADYGLFGNSDYIKF
jgi:hypothetical protein